MKQLSLCYTTYNRLDTLINSFRHIHDHPIIGEICIRDDASDWSTYYAIQDACDSFPKVRLERNSTNVDCYMNKSKVIGMASFDWCILFDSDNLMNEDYLNKIASMEWDKKTILAPCFARPHFDYRAYSGLIVDKSNVAGYFDQPMFQTALNTCNFFVNKQEYCWVWDGSINPVTSDSIYFAYCWLAFGNKIHIVEGLQYDHPISEDSHYKLNVSRTPEGFHRQIEDKIRSLR
jgi:glycosyltransferase involved in cell wall biosynthesis